MNEIIAYASRAFALYYMLQCLVAAVVARELENRRRQTMVFGLLALGCFAVFAFGLPAE